MEQHRREGRHEPEHTGGPTILLPQEDQMAEGEQAQQCADAIADLFDKGFNEGIG